MSLRFEQAEKYLDPAVLEATVKALAQFDKKISPWASPSAWLDANNSHIISILQKAGQMIGNYEFIKAYLGDIVTAWKLQNIHKRATFEALRSLDVVALSAQLNVVLMDHDRYTRLLERRGQSAQSLLDIIQARLDYPIEPQFKRRYLKALVKLSELSRRYPECLQLKHITLPEYYVVGGSFGEVYKGRMAGNDIAVKVLKVYQDSDMDAILKRAQFLNQETGRTLREKLLFGDSSIIQMFSPSLANILVSDARRACLADFGLSIAKDTLSANLTTSSGATCGTLNWMAPELLPDMHETESSESDTKRPDEACDVHSFGMMFSGRIPFHNKRDFQVMYAISAGKRPERPFSQLAQTRGLSDHVWDIVVACWRPQPAERLTAEQIIQRLRNLPELPTDDRPLDDYRIPPPSRMLYQTAQHPFAMLEMLTEKATVDGIFNPSELSVRSSPWDRNHQSSRSPSPEAFWGAR
ncbi:hypothetical protein HWV62_13449 [Athelia sp. TMB]|nr:hypothetical protein HWV62_13449 [Athelia sp. TMB]